MPSTAEILRRPKGSAERSCADFAATLADGDGVLCAGAKCGKMMELTKIDTCSGYGA